MRPQLEGAGAGAGSEGTLASETPGLPPARSRSPCPTHGTACELHALGAPDFTGSHRHSGNHRQLPPEPTPAGSRRPRGAQRSL